MALLGKQLDVRPPGWQEVSQPFGDPGTTFPWRTSPMPARWPECGRTNPRRRRRLRQPRPTLQPRADTPAGVAGESGRTGWPDRVAGPGGRTGWTAWSAVSAAGVSGGPERLAGAAGLAAGRSGGLAGTGSFGAGSLFRCDFGRKWPVSAPKAKFRAERGAENHHSRRSRYSQRRKWGDGRAMAGQTRSADR